MAPHFLPLVEWLRANGAMTGAEGMECNWLVDPGNYALAGAGAMLAGTVRLNIFVIMLMVEVTGRVPDVAPQAHSPIESHSSPPAPPSTGDAAPPVRV